MAHIHLPDGAFQLQWVIFWFAIASSIIVLLVLKYRRNHYFDINKLSRAAILATFTFAIFQVEAPFFGGLHLSFTPLLGITLGPILGCASILVVNIFSAALGHSGWNILGANFLINSIEVTISYALFLLFEKFTKSSFAKAGLSTLIALITGSLTMTVILAVSGIQGSSLTFTEIIQNLLPLTALNLVAAFIESIITSFAVAYIFKIKPDLLSKNATDVDSSP